MSLTCDAARREVTRHAGGESSVVGDDIFDVLESAMAAGEQWFGYFGYACRPDLPARPDPTLPDAVWMRARAVRVFEHEELPVPSESPDIRGLPHVSGVATPDTRGTPLTSAVGQGREGGAVAAGTAPPEEYAAAFAEVQEHLHAGNSYEVNLTYRLAQDAARPRPGGGVPPAPRPQPRAVRRLPPARRRRRTGRGCSPELAGALRPDHPRPDLETKPIKGTTPRGATAEEDEAPRASGWPATRRPARRT